MSAWTGEGATADRQPAASAAGPFRRLRDAQALGALLLLQTVLFFRPLFLETFFFRDLYLLFFGQRTALADQLRHGLLPLWDPFHHGGQALLANLNNTALYPTSLLYLLLPPVPAFNLEIVGHLAFAGVAAYLCARALDFAPRVALAAGLVFELCGVTLSSANLVNRLFALPWLPVLVLALVLFFREPRRRWYALAVLAGTLQVLAGFPELVLLTWITAGLFAACADPAPGGFFRKARAVAGAGATSFGLSAVQLMPLIALVSRSSRSEGAAGSWATWSVHPGRLPELLLPGFLGPVTSLAEESYWGRFIEDGRFPYFLSISFGVTCAGLVLASVAGVGIGVLPHRLRLGLAAFALACVVASLGRHLPGLSDVAALPVPLFRYPVKFLAGALLPAALLAADGLARLTDARSGRLGSAVAVAPFGVALSFLAWERAAPDAFQATFFRASPSLLATHGLDRVLLQAALVGGGFWALSLTRPGGPARRYGLLLLLTVELALAGRPVNSYAPRTLLTSEPPLAATVRSVAADGRLYRHEPGGPERIVAPSDDILWLAGRTLGSLGKYTAASFRIPVVFHVDYDGLALRQIVALGEELKRRPWSGRLPALSAAGVGAVLTPDPSASAELPLAARGSVPGGGTLYLLRNPGALPPAQFVTQAWGTSTIEGQLGLVLDGRGGRRLDPRETVVLTGSDRPSPPGPCTSTVRRFEGGPAYARYEVANTCDGFLVFSTPLDDGWHARVDGRSVPVLRANYAFQAVPLAAGRHEVRHAYVPEGLVGGLAITGLSALLLLMVLRRPARRPFHRPPPGPATSPIRG